MVLTQKETMLLQDLKSQEQLCIEKYSKYAANACDAPLQQLFETIRSTEQTHLDTVNQMLNGTVPAMAGGQGQPKWVKPAAPSSCGQGAKAQDMFLCQDALSMEKHVSSVYDTCIFEFKDANARNVLNHIQKEEQEHGQYIYDYMALNGMY